MMSPLAKSEAAHWIISVSLRGYIWRFIWLSCCAKYNCKSDYQKKIIFIGRTKFDSDDLCLYKEWLQPLDIGGASVRHPVGCVGGATSFKVMFYNTTCRWCHHLFIYLIWPIYQCEWEHPQICTPCLPLANCSVFSRLNFSKVRQRVRDNWKMKELIYLEYKL